MLSKGRANVESALIALPVASDPPSQQRGRGAHINANLSGLIFSLTEAIGFVKHTSHIKGYLLTERATGFDVGVQLVWRR